MADRLQAGGELNAGLELVSQPRGWFKLAVNTDGKLLVIRTLSNLAVWESQGGPVPGGGYFMQADGNFVAYGPNGAYWSTGTQGNPGAWVVIQDDGNLVVCAAGGQPIWASNSVQDMASPTARYGDARGYTYNETSETWKDLCLQLPCFLALQWPGYATGIVEEVIGGQPAVIQWWKGWCPKFLGLPFLADWSPFPGGVGAEVGIYRRIPGKARPASLPFLPPPVEASVMSALSRLTDSDLWWPAPELGATMEFTLTNPVTGTEFFSGGPQGGYWLAKWMDDGAYGKYRRDLGLNSPLLPEWWPNNSKTPVDPADFILQFKVNGKTYPSIPPGRPVPRAPAQAVIGAVSRSANKLDVFAAGQDGAVRTAAWEPAFTSGWGGWWDIPGAKLPAGAPISAVSRSPEKLDIFATDEIGRVVSAAWEPGFASWHGWQHIQGGVSAPGGHVASVARGADKLDIFTVGTDSKLYTAAWDQAVSGGWRGWQRVADIELPQGAPVHAVCRRTDVIDLFATDAAGVTRASYWRPGMAGWADWAEIAGGRAAPGAPVTAAVRGLNRLDIFVVGLDGRVYTTGWHPKQRGGWRAWAPIGDAHFPATAPIHAVSRANGKLDIFGTDLTGRIITAAWDQAVPGGWRGWWEIAGGRAAPGAAVTGVSRSANKLDVFVTGTDGQIYTAAWEQAFGGAWHGWWAIAQP